MSLFVNFNCQIFGDSIVNHVAWSQLDQILALSVYSVDENDREVNQVIFTNNEVCIMINCHFCLKCSFVIRVKL